MTDDGSAVRLWRNDNGYLMIDTGEELVAHHRLLATVQLKPDEVAGRDAHHRSGVKIDTVENIDAVARAAHSQLHSDEDRLPDPSDVF